MPTKVHKSKEETRAAIEQEIASIATDLERLRSIIQRTVEHQEVIVETAPAAQPQQPEVVAN
jgi:hypothetical protein